DRFTVEMLQAETACPACCNIVPEQMGQDIWQEVVPDREGILNCEDVARCLRRPDPASEPQEAGARGVSERFRACSATTSHNLAQKQGLADFLKDADIRLVHTPGCSVVRADFILKLHREGQRLPRRQEAESAYVDCRTALVTHEEVQVWADGKAPDGTQVSKLAKALTGKEWLFIDYVSLHQFQRLS
ncbi:Nlrc3, partial [Symbiodinium necroappetens]